MDEEAERQRRALRCARELAHAATSLASEAATLARLLELNGALDSSIAASQASIQAAQAAFDADASTRVVGSDLGEALRCALRALDAAESAVRASRVAVTQAVGGGAAGSDAHGVGAG